MADPSRQRVDHRIVLRDLQTILSKKFGDEFVVVTFTTEFLLPPGENFGSTMFEVVASVKRNADAPEEDFHLVAKMLPALDVQRMMYESPVTFKKEIFFYVDLIPSYKRLEVELGCPEEEAFNIAPEFIESRLSLKPEVDEVDDDAVIAMENLKVKGFYTVDRRVGMDLSHSTTAIQALARFHALGMAVKYKKPDYFDLLKVRSKCCEYNEDDMKVSKEFLVKTMCEDAELEKYSAQIKAAMSRSYKALRNAVPSEPWSTIVHADFWTNNIMFHRDSEGNVDDVKIVDFQNYLFSNPVNEVIFFLFLCPTTQVITDHFDHLLNVYYDTLISIMKKLKCDVSQFSRQSFDARIKVDAFSEFVHCAIMIKVSTMEKEQDDESPSKGTFVTEMLAPKTSAMLSQKLRTLVKTYVERGWFEVLP